jgi:RimJ/RimL family protein N-acetyltransferase
VVTEARTALINHFFRHAPVDRFVGELNGRNTASLFNYRRLGFDHVGTWHRHVRNPVTGEVLDVMMFELPREKWLASPLAAADLATPLPSENTP